MLYSLFIFIHGLIHSAGFVKGFGIKEVKALTLPISRSMGVFWLIATLLFLLYGILNSMNARYAWAIALLAVILSQILVFIFWKDAKFGSIPNLIILYVALLNFGSFRIQEEFTAQVNTDFSENNASSTAVLTAEDIVHLPLIVQKYLHYTKSVGQPKIRNFRAEFTGGMRGNPDDEYMKFSSVQYNFYQRPSRYFYMEASKLGLPATGLHIYKHETATFNVKLLNWFPVVDARGEKMDQAETVTLFNDMCCIAPATLIDKRISWEVLNDTSVRGVFKNGSLVVSAVLYFNSEGQLVNFISNDRYETDGKVYNSYPWATPLKAYKMMNGYLLPGKAKLIYQKSEGEFTYGELEYKSVEYNLNGIRD